MGKKDKIKDAFKQIEIELNICSFFEVILNKRAFERTSLRSS